MRLHLERTKITDKGLEQIKGLENLEYLNLYGTEIGDAGLDYLTNLKKLKSLYLWQTKVTDEGVKKLQEAATRFEDRPGHVTPDLDQFEPVLTRTRRPGTFRPFISLTFSCGLPSVGLFRLCPGNCRAASRRVF